jgi:hypothetical protein
MRFWVKQYNSSTTSRFAYCFAKYNYYFDPMIKQVNVSPYRLSETIEARLTIYLRRKV